MKQWLCVLVVCGCGLTVAQSAELRQTSSLVALEGDSVHFQEPGSPVALGLGGPAMALIGGDGVRVLSASWGEIQGGCLVPETGDFASLLTFVRGAAIRVQAAHEKGVLLRAFSLLILMMLLGLTAAICLEPEQGRSLEAR